MTASTLLLLATLGLLLGPLAALAGARLRALHALVDGIALAAVGGLCVVFVLPHVVGTLGAIGGLLVVAGVALPALVGRVMRGSSWRFAVVALALTVHVILDGAVLTLGSHEAALGWAVVVHRLPVGFAIVFAGRAAGKGASFAAWVACFMAAATAAGFFAGPGILDALPHSAPHAIEALVAGVLLHVLFGSHAQDGQPACTHSHDHGHAHHDHGHGHHAHGHAHHDHGHAHHDHGHGHHDHGHAHHDHGHAHCDHGHDHHEHSQHHDHSHHHDHTHLHSEVEAGRGSGAAWSAVGALGGITAIGLGTYLAGAGALGADVAVFLKTLRVLVLESAPALVLGYALAGVLPFLLTPSRVKSLGHGGRLSQSLRGVVFGLPLPVCSCGVLPLYASLVRRGAPLAAAMAFFVATPELGLDAVLLSMPLLGTSLTIARVAAAFAVALLAGVFLSRMAEISGEAQEAEEESAAPAPWRERLNRGLRFGFVEIFDHTMPWIGLGLVLAALAEPMLSHDAIAAVPTFLQVPMAAIIGVPLYVCASGATPLAALALHKGLSAGAVIAFLIAGPATNMTTFGVLARLHGKKLAVYFGIAVTVLAVIAGWITDLSQIEISAVVIEQSHVDGSWLSWSCVAALGLLTIASLFRQGPRGALQQIFEPIHSH